MTAGRISLSITAGLALAALPFLHYSSLGHGPAHANHEARHGGQLGMVGEYHIEVRRGAGVLEAFVSDAWRRPVQPREGSVVFDRRRTAPLAWQGHRLVGVDSPAAQQVEAIVLLDDGTRLALSFDFSAPLPQGEVSHDT